MSATILVNAPPPKPAPQEWPWYPCTYCGEQGRIYQTDKRKKITTVLYCPKCLGIGSIPEDFIA